MHRTRPRQRASMHSIEMRPEIGKGKGEGKVENQGGQKRYEFSLFATFAGCSKEAVTGCQRATVTVYIACYAYFGRAGIL